MTAPPDPLRDAFAGINARFHLAGIYTLAALLLRMAQTYESDDPAWAGIMAAALVLFHGSACGILGLVFQAAAGRPGRISFAGYAAWLFVPLLWLSIKIVVLVYGLFALCAWLVHATAAAGTPFEDWVKAAFFWSGPLVGLAAQALALYSMPLSILARERGERRAPIREGLRLFRLAPSASRSLGLVLILIAALGGGLEYARGPDAKEVAPDVPEALILFATSYLSLVTFFAAARLVLSVAAEPPRAAAVPPAAEPPAAAGPPR